MATVVKGPATTAAAVSSLGRQHQHVDQQQHLYGQHQQQQQQQQHHQQQHQQHHHQQQSRDVSSAGSENECIY